MPGDLNLARPTAITKISRPTSNTSSSITWKTIRAALDHAPFDVYLDHNVFQPDIVVVRNPRLTILTDAGTEGASNSAQAGAIYRLPGNVFAR